MNSEEKNYLESLNQKEKHAYEIAKNHLGSSFHLMKSNGFLQWKKKNPSIPNVVSASPVLPSNA
jgi:hypothetical protein